MVMSQKIGSKYAVLELQSTVLQNIGLFFVFTPQTRRAVNMNWWIDKKIIHSKNLNSQMCLYVI